MQTPPPLLQPMPRRHHPTAIAAALVIVLLIAGAFVYTRISGNDSISAVEPAVVNITGQLGDGTSIAGTGMLIDSRGFVLTNNHVADGVHNIEVEVPATHKTYSGTELGGVASQDVAVIEIQGASGLPVVPTGHSGSVRTGDHVTAVGNALGFGGAPTVSQCHIDGLNQTITATGDGTSETLNGMLQISGVVEPGDSGGPLIDTSGKVIGMDTASNFGFTAFSGSEGYAIPIDTAIALAHQIMGD
jgi:S1-C subfamily serine protease